MLIIPRAHGLCLNPLMCNAYWLEPIERTGTAKSLRQYPKQYPSSILSVSYQYPRGNPDTHCEPLLWLTSQAKDYLAPRPFHCAENPPGSAVQPNNIHDLSWDPGQCHCVLWREQTGRCTAVAWQQWLLLGNHYCVVQRTFKLNSLQSSI